VPGEGRRALLILAIGASVAAAAQFAIPVGMPLYDGVVITEPYRYLHPGSGQPDSPSSFASEPGLDEGSSRAFAAATTENPPQAQLIALPKAFAVPAGATSMKVSITPVEPGAAPAAGSIAGNVYRFSVTDGSGAELAATGDPRPTITLRAPDGVVDASIGHLAGASWQLVETDHTPGLGLYSTSPSVLGDYALIVGGGKAATLDLGLVAAAVVTVGAPVIVGIVLFVRRRRDRTLQTEAARGRGRIPSKRKPPRQGPDGGRRR
jgi:hypothetical protein